MRSQETTTLAATKLALHFAHEEEDMVGSRGDAQPRPAGQCTQLVWWSFLRAGVEVSPVIVNSGDSSERCDANANARVVREFFGCTSNARRGATDSPFFLFILSFLSSSRAMLCSSRSSMSIE